MSKGSRLGLAALLAGALLMPLVPAPQAQGDQCAGRETRIACSTQCCGRKSCPPSCEIDCVKLCVDGCRDPAKKVTFEAQKSTLQRRCGYRAAN